MKGICLAMENPYGSKQINISRRAVLRQYYGKDASFSHSKNGTPRFTYGYTKCNSSVNTDPLNYITRPFNYYLLNIAKQLNLMLKNNCSQLNLDGVDLSYKFNHCSTLLYYASPILKPKAYMPFHCDITYNHKGEYVTMNEQVENTPSVIISLGDDRTLEWRRQICMLNPKTRRFKWYNVDKNDFCRSFKLGDKTIFIVNTLDERPAIDPKSGCFIRYQHGNVQVSKKTMSCALVFRIVKNICSYDDTNKLQEQYENLENKKSDEINVLDHVMFHKEVQKLFLDTFKSYRA